MVCEAKNSGMRKRDIGEKNMAHRKCNVFLCVFLCVACLSACQPTPEAPPLAKRTDGLPEGAVADTLPEGHYRVIDAPVRWAERLLLSDGMVLIEADVELDIPIIANIPIVEIAQKDIKSEDVQEMARYFCGTDSVYCVPGLTVVELEAMIGVLETGENLTISQGNWKETILENLRGHLEAAQDKAVKEQSRLVFDAPAIPDDVYVGGEAWRRRTDPVTDEKAFIDAMAETGEAGIGTRIQARAYNERAGTSSSFVYTRGIVSSPEERRLELFYLDFMEDSANTTYHNYNRLIYSEQAYREQERERLDRIGMISQHTGISLDEATSLAIGCLDDLGIRDMVLADSDYAIQYLTDGYYQFRFDNRDVDFDKAKGGYYLTFFRGADRIPSCRIIYGAVLANEYTTEKLPAAPPFFPEYVTFFITDEGIQHFGWHNIGQPVRLVADNVNLLSFDVIKKAMADYIAAVSARATGSGETVEYRVESAALRYAYQKAYNAPDRAWMVPVWVFQMKSYMSIPGGAIRNIDLDLQIGALDAIPVIPEEYTLAVYD